MATFEMQLPDDVIKQFETISQNSEKIFGEMTKAGADVVLHNIRANIPESLKDSAFMKCLKVTKVYRTPSDGGINTKVGFFGYFETKEGRTVPAPLVANVYEYGRSSVPFPKQPFLRKSFKKNEIEKAMLDVQKELSGGLLELCGNSPKTNTSAFRSSWAFHKQPILKTKVF